jgi:hypothetical protein
MTTNETSSYVLRGNGAAIHVAKRYYREDGTMWLLAALCDGWGATASRRVRGVEADAATCKSCIRIATKEA